MDTTSANIKSTGGVVMDILEFYNIYIDASEDIRNQIKEIVYNLSENPVSLEEDEKSD